MLRVRLEMVPGGDERRAREIGLLEISNVSELACVSNYVYSSSEYGRDGELTGGCTGGKVLWHRRSDGAWQLVRRVLEDMEREPTIAHQEAAPEASKE